MIEQGQQAKAIASCAMAQGRTLLQQAAVPGDVPEPLGLREENRESVQLEQRVHRPWSPVAELVAHVSGDREGPGGGQRKGVEGTVRHDPFQALLEDGWGRLAEAPKGTEERVDDAEEPMRCPQVVLALPVVEQRRELGAFVERIGRGFSGAEDPLGHRSHQLAGDVRGVVSRDVLIDPQRAAQVAAAAVEHLVGCLAQHGRGGQRLEALRERDCFSPQHVCVPIATLGLVVSDDAGHRVRTCVPAEQAGVVAVVAHAAGSKIGGEKVPGALQEVAAVGVERGEHRGEALVGGVGGEVAVEQVELKQREGDAGLAVIEIFIGLGGLICERLAVLK